VKMNGRLDGGGTLFAASAIMVGSMFVGSTFGILAGTGAFVVASGAAGLAALASAARRLSLLGFTHQDLAPAFKAEIEQAREERAIEHGREASKLEKGLRLVTRVGWPVSVASAGATFWAVRATPPYDWLWVAATNRLFELTILIAFASVVTSAMYGYLLQRRRDVDTEIWFTLWRGRIGKAAFSLARRLLGTRTLGSAITHRATELSLGLAAEQLYESLPKGAKRELAALPDIVRRLQDDAQRLRRFHDELQDAIADAGDAGASDAYAEVRAHRDAVQARLADAVGALETIRLNLLRLHAGSGTVEGLTTHIDLAADVSAEVERLLAARDEVERSLAFPRETATTPV